MAWPIEALTAELRHFTADERDRLLTRVKQDLRAAPQPSGVSPVPPSPVAEERLHGRIDVSPAPPSEPARWTPEADGSWSVRIAGRRIDDA